MRGLRVRSVSVGQDIQRCACAVPCFRTWAARLRVSVSHVLGSVVSVAGASTIQCITVLRASRCILGWLVWWLECLKRSPSASGVAGFASGVNVWTLSVVPMAFHCATHNVCWWHVSVTVGVAGGLSIKTAQSVTFGPSVFRSCCSGGLVRVTEWFTRSGVRVSSVSCTLSLRAVGWPTATSHASVVAARVLAASWMTVLFPRQGGRELGCVFHGEV